MQQIPGATKDKFFKFKALRKQLQSQWKMHLNFKYSTTTTIFDPQYLILGQFSPYCILGRELVLVGDHLSGRGGGDEIRTLYFRLYQSTDSTHSVIADIGQ